MVTENAAVIQAQFDVIEQAVLILDSDSQGTKWDALKPDIQDLGLYIRRTLKKNKPVTPEQENANARRNDIVYTILCALDECEGAEEIRKKLGEQFPVALAKAEEYRLRSNIEMRKVSPEYLEFYLKAAAAADVLAEYVKSTLVTKQTPKGEDPKRNFDHWGTEGYASKNVTMKIPSVSDPDASDFSTPMDKQLHGVLYEYVQALEKISPIYEKLKIKYDLSYLLYEKLGYKDESIRPFGKIDIKIKPKSTISWADEEDDEPLDEPLKPSKPTLEVKMTVAEMVIDLVKAQVRQK